MNLDKPDYVYKYIFLDDDYEESEKRINALKNKATWFSAIAFLNDPFEFNSIYYEEKNYLADNFSEYKNIVDNLMRHTRKYCFISCFTTKPNNMPMWAHYANNHKGFVIKYKVNNKQILGKVKYSDEKFNITNIINDTFQLRNKYPLVPEVYHYSFKKIMNNTMELIALYKHMDWKYENEYRIIRGDDNIIETSYIKNIGGLVCNSDLGLEIIEIYLGKNCSQKNKEELIKATCFLNIPVFQMSSSSGGSKFDLIKNKLEMNN